jgi:hypothetical protein
VIDVGGRIRVSKGGDKGYRSTIMVKMNKEAKTEFPEDGESYELFLK